MFAVATVVFNWRGETNKSSLYSIHFRITLDRVSRYYKVQIPSKVSYQQWSGVEDAWVKATHPFSFENNSKIREKKTVVLSKVANTRLFSLNDVDSCLFGLLGN